MAINRHFLCAIAAAGLLCLCASTTATAEPTDCRPGLLTSIFGSAEFKLVERFRLPHPPGKKILSAYFTGSTLLNIRYFNHDLVSLYDISGATTPIAERGDAAGYLWGHRSLTSEKGYVERRGSELLQYDGKSLEIIGRHNFALPDIDRDSLRLSDFAYGNPDRLVTLPQGFMNTPSGPIGFENNLDGSIRKEWHLASSDYPNDGSKPDVHGFSIRTSIAYDETSQLIVWSLTEGNNITALIDGARITLAGC